MAFLINPDAQSVFFAKIFGPTHPVTETAKALVAAGVTFEVSMYTIKANAPGKKLPSMNTTYGTTTIMKGLAPPSVMAQNKLLIESWINEVALKMGMVVPAPTQPKPKSDPQVTQSGPAALMLTGYDATKKLLTIKKVVDMTGLSVLDAKELIESVGLYGSVKIKEFDSIPQAEVAASVLFNVAASTNVVQVATSTVVSVFDPTKPTPPQPTFNFDSPVAPKPVPEVIKLKDAQALGQKVHSTSVGSVYYCIGIGEHIKVAARLKGEAISIRAEWIGTPTADLAKLKEAGLDMKEGYASIHFGTQGVPVPRVIGAFLVGTGIQWKQSVTNGSELAIGG